jgi:predicted transcriptional regulator
MKKSHPIPVRLDLDVKDALEADAEAQERSQAWLINRILRDHYGLEASKRPKKGK